ncbi:MAG: TOBE domain-containing protein, partial [Anaerolineae bacterium]|nr:TOBE domain-containing protein [Anaerolineae bacterium]
NVVPVLKQEGQRAETPVGTFLLDFPADCVLLHPVGIELTNGSDELPSIPAEVIERRFKGSIYGMKVRHSSGYVLRFDVSSQQSALPAVGDQIALHIAPEMVVALRDGESQIEPLPVKS